MCIAKVSSFCMVFNYTVLGFKRPRNSRQCPTQSAKSLHRIPFAQSFHIEKKVRELWLAFSFKSCIGSTAIFPKGTNPKFRNVESNKGVPMTTGKRIRQAVSAGRPALTEHEAKSLLGEYGVPVIQERIVQSSHEAGMAAAEIGFPVVVKGVGSEILHKTERGLVHLNLKTVDEVKTSVDAISQSAGSDLEGILVQPQIQGSRELVAGLFRDRQFGPVIMFGLGGIFTEALSDVTFRLAPLSDIDASEMLDEIRSTALLGSMRGEKPVQRNQLVQTLVGLSRLAGEFPEIAEIDINPLRITPDGRVIALDALAVLQAKKTDDPTPPPVDPLSTGSIFHPRSIAFVGASAQMGKWGHMLVTNTISGGYRGKIYLVNPKGGQIAGRPVYRTVTDIDDSVDLAVVTIPAKHVLGLIPEFSEKKIRNMLLITSGFGETGHEGKTLENRLARAAQEAGILILGPNTMGICNPHINLYCTGSLVQPLAGSTAMVAQSGNMGTQLLAFAEAQGIGIRAFSGSGNEAMITIEDFLDGFELDDLSRIVMLYIESVKNGRRFFESARRVGRKKPIILLKGGQSRAGNRAAASHTGALTTDTRVFDAVCRQAGIIKVEQSMDLLDLTAAFSSLPLPKGNRVAIMTLGGGWGVVTADLCSRYGLTLPELSPDLIQRMDEILPPYWSRANPVDIVGERDFSIPMTIMEALIGWDGCDGVINLGILGRRIFADRMGDAILKADPGFSKDFVEFARKALREFEQNYIEHIIRLMETYQKPVYGVSLLKDKDAQTVYRLEGSEYKGLFYETPERAVKAFAKMVEYDRFLRRSDA